MPLYFAYGSNMDVEGMMRRCPRAKPLGVARLARHQLAIMREGWLTAVRDPRGDVYGVLWDVAFADMRALDQYEQLASGLYTKTQQPVIGKRGARQALVYFGANSGPGVASADYIADVLAAARHWRQPAATIARLESFAAAAGIARAGAPANGEPAATNSEPGPRVRPRFATPFDQD
jgi:Gamma-glutamyl cyclotransferase, AIG2-like